MRRNIPFKLAISLMLLIIGGVICWSFGTYMFFPFFKNSEERSFVEIASLNSLVEEQPTLIAFEHPEHDVFQKYNLIHRVWVIKHSSTKVTVFSPFCPDMSCRYHWDNDSKKFVCPCDASVYSITGKVISGPSPRPLDTLPWKIKDGKLFIEWIKFKPGIPEKIEIALTLQRSQTR